jgi:hypothetical protein
MIRSAFFWFLALVATIAFMSGPQQAVTFSANTGHIVGQTVGVVAQSAQSLASGHGLNLNLNGISSQAQHKAIQGVEHAGQGAAKAGINNATKPDSLGGILPGSVDKAGNDAFKKAVDKANKAATQNAQKKDSLGGLTSLGCWPFCH